MKKVIATLLLLSSTMAMGQSRAPEKHEINRRNFVSLNSDAGEMKLIVHYPGGSPITEVCGIQFLTNIPVFANSHLNAFVREIQLLDDKGRELSAEQSLAEPPVYKLESVETMGVTFSIRTRSGESLRRVVRQVAESERLKFDREPEIIAVAKHCPN